MRKGGGKQKGSAFEREVCKELSLWISHGKRTDCFWRSAMSGGRATVQRKRKVNVRQSGDICSVSPEGHKLTDVWYIECKHVKDLRIAEFIFKGTGPLVQYWKKARQEARAGSYHRDPILIARQNGWPTLVITELGELASFIPPDRIYARCEIRGCDISLFTDLTSTKFDW